MNNKIPIIHFFNIMIQSHTKLSNKENMKKIISKDFFKTEEIFSSATYDNDKYRTTLSRQWSPSNPIAQVICRCPSTASANEEDSTTKRLRIILENLGYGGYYLINVKKNFENYIKSGEIDTIISWGATIRKSKESSKYRKLITNKCKTLYQFNKIINENYVNEVLPTRLANNTQLIKIQYRNNNIIIN